ANNLLPTYGPHASQTQTPATPNVFTFTNAGGNTVTLYNNVFDTWCRQFVFDPAAAYPYGSNVAPAPYRPRAGAVWQPAHTYTAGALVDAPPDPALNPNSSANGLVYMCTTGGLSGATNPFQMTDTPGNTVMEPAGVGPLTWTVLPPVALQAVQITV